MRGTIGPARRPGEDHIIRGRAAKEKGGRLANKRWAVAASGERRACWRTTARSWRCVSSRADGGANDENRNRIWSLDASPQRARILCQAESLWGAAPSK